MPACGLLLLRSNNDSVQKGQVGQEISPIVPRLAIEKMRISSMGSMSQSRTKLFAMTRNGYKAVLSAGGRATQVDS